jgi:hypothetical protein
MENGQPKTKPNKNVAGRRKDTGMKRKETTDEEGGDSSVYYFLL